MDDEDVQLMFDEFADHVTTAKLKTAKLHIFIDWHRGQTRDPVVGSAAQHQNAAQPRQSEDLRNSKPPTSPHNPTPPTGAYVCHPGMHREILMLHLPDLQIDTSSLELLW